jgi:DNA-binding transcriptional ArsR family regulator
VESEEVLRRLDRIAAILELAFREPIDSARQEIRADSVAAAILDLTAENWVSAGDVKRTVSGQTGQSERTVSRRLSTLVGQAFVEAEGQGPTVRYRATGIV